MRALKWLFFTASKKNGISSVSINFKKRALYITNFGNRTLCRPIQSVIILVIDQIGLPLHGRMITDQIGLCSVLLTLLIKQP